MLECPICGSLEIYLLGQLGDILHLRCSACGMGFMTDVDENKQDEEEDG